MIIRQSRNLNIVPEIYSISFAVSIEENQAIMAASSSKRKGGISSRSITDELVRVKSSNLWARCIDIKNAKDKTGTVYVQFKGDRGGPGDIYCYFDVPVMIYRKMIAEPSAGHAFWKYIRGKFSFAKLTGDKRTKQRGGINSRDALERIAKSHQQLVESDKVSDRIQVANETDDIEVFEKLAEDPSEDVRAAVARNCQDQDIQETLVLDDSAKVRRSLIGNTKDKEILRVLAYDDDETVRYEMSKTCKDPSILKEMLNDPSAKVRNSVKRTLEKMQK